MCMRPSILFFENFALLNFLMFHMKHQAAQGQNTGARMR